MKIVFFGTSPVGLPVLAALHQHHSVVHVVTSPDAPVGRKQIITPSPIGTWAAEHGIPTSKPATVKNNEELLTTLKELQADIFIVVSYGKILPVGLINLPPLRTLNIHFSLLPKYRGASPIQGALLQGDTETGTTIFVLEEKMDTGPIIAQEPLPIQPADTFTSVADKLSTLSANLLIDTLPRYASGELVPSPQDDAAASYVSLITKEDGRIDWSESAEKIHNRYRAFIEWPGVWTTWNGKQLKILHCSIGPNESGAIGTVRGTRVQCGNNTTLLLHAVQLEGKTASPIEQFSSGYPQFDGSTLGT